jgi:hypothetical protein
MDNTLRIVKKITESQSYLWFCIRMERGFSPPDKAKIGSAWELGAQDNTWSQEGDSNRGRTRLHNEKLHNFKSSNIIRVQ